MQLAVGSKMSALLCQAVEVSYHGFDFIGLQTLAVSRHLAFALLDRTGEFVVAHLRDFGIGKTPHLHRLALGRLTFAVRAMARCAFLLVWSRAFLVSFRWCAEDDR